MRLDELAQKIGAELSGDGAIEVHRVAAIETAGPGDVTFLSNQRYARLLATTNASAAIVGPTERSERIALLRTADPYYAFQQAVVALHGFRRHPHEGIHPAATIDPTATIGRGTVVYPGVYVGPRAKVGEDCILYPNCVIYDECILGDRVIIHSGAAIGPDGYGFAYHAGAHHKIPQVGNVILEDDVEIGANSVVARGAIGPTVIGRGTKLDAAVMIGHGVRIGQHCLVVAQVGISGSTTLGNYVTLAGQVGIAGHLKIGNGVTVAAKSGIMDDVPDKATLMGTPGMPANQARRVMLAQMQLPEVLMRLREIEKRLEKLDPKPSQETES